MNELSEEFDQRNMLKRVLNGVSILGLVLSVPLNYSMVLIFYLEYHYALITGENTAMDASYGVWLFCVLMLLFVGYPAWLFGLISQCLLKGKALRGVGLNLCALSSVANMGLFIFILLTGVMD